MNDEIEMAATTDEELRKQAISSIKRKREFAQHLTTYLVVNAVLIAIWAISGAGYFWPAWVLGGWGIGLALHAWDTYGRRRTIAEDEIAREMEKLRR
ncbi:MAG TPA: 2TM domain-containing protein [Solirubrobacterales bacterium]|nr:2TM domain-containing protein [Solirubrobacterales bacterium]